MVPTPQVCLWFDLEICRRAVTCPACRRGADVRWPDGFPSRCSFQYVELKVPTAPRAVLARGRVQIVVTIPCAPLKFGGATLERRRLSQAMSAVR